MSRLELDRLNKSYGTLRALTDLSFAVEAGEIFGFVGSNGAGKTTAMRIVLGVLSADSGQVRWNGAELDLRARRQVGYMPEERGLYPKMKVGQQLVYLARLHGMSTAEATTAMEHWTAVLNVDARRDDEVQKLSLGNQQRVQLAAALVHNPKVLVLDEPFSGLDPVAVEIMSQVLRERAADGVPVVFSSHQLDLVERLCDRVGVISAGQMAAVGTIDDLRTTPTERWRIVGSAPPGWAEGIPGTRVLSQEGPETVVELFTPGPDAEQPLLHAALAAGSVREFALIRPSLTDLFRNVVRTEGAVSTEGTEGGAGEGRIRDGNPAGGDAEHSA